MAQYFAQELESGDTILSGQTFETERSRALATDTGVATLRTDVTVERVRPHEWEADHVVVSLRGSSHRLVVHSARVVRVANP